MFNKGSETQASPSAPSTHPREPAKAPGMPSIISADLRIVGDLHCAGDIQVEGDVEGDIKSQSVTIGEGAKVSGSIYADTVRVSGAVKGQIEASSVMLAKTARVTGDLMHKTLSIEAGAHLEGNCRRIQDEKKPTAEAKVTDLKPTQRDAPSAAASASAGSASAGDTGGSGESAGKPAAS